jgi:hypothetical protein
MNNYDSEFNGIAGSFILFNTLQTNLYRTLLSHLPFFLPSAFTKFYPVYQAFSLAL